MSQVKWGILGCANIARKATIPAILAADNSELYAVASRSKSKAESFAEEFGAEKFYDDYQKLLEDKNIDAVYIPLPNKLHKEWTIKAADAGKNILCEKPLSGSSKKEAEEMLRAAKENDVLLMEGFMYRFQPFVIKLKEMVDKGVVGKIKEIKANFAFDVSDRGQDLRLNAELDGGALNDIGCYTVNIARYLMGKNPTKVANFFEKESEAGVDLSGSATLYFEGGSFASLYYSIMSYEEKDIEVIGTKGIIKVPGFFAWKDQNYFLVEQEGHKQKMPVETDEQYRLEVEAFADAVLNQKDVPLSVESESFANLEVVDAMRKSAAEDVVVSL